LKLFLERRKYKADIAAMAGTVSSATRILITRIRYRQALRDQAHRQTTNDAPKMLDYSLISSLSMLQIRNVFNQLPFFSSLTEMPHFQTYTLHHRRFMPGAMLEFLFSISSISDRPV